MARNPTQIKDNKTGSDEDTETVAVEGLMHDGAAKDGHADEVRLPSDDNLIVEADLTLPETGAPALDGWMDNAIHEGTEDSDSQAAGKEHFDQSKFDKPLDIADIAIGKALDSVLDQ